MTSDDLGTRLAPLTAFMGAKPLTQAIADLEYTLDGSLSEDVPAKLQNEGVTEDLLRAAFDARAEFGRINDLIHAAAIGLALPHLLEPGERLLRPSLAAGNDPSRPYDVATNRRIAEFKLSRWDGHDAGRKRQLFKDLVNLALAQPDGRRVQMFVLGERPLKFLNSTRSTAAWALNRMADRTKEQFEAAFGTADVPIPSFVRGHAGHVELVDLERLLPQYFSAT